MCTCEEPVVSITAVTSQLELVLRESQLPVQALGEAIARIHAGPDFEAGTPQLRQDVSRCLEAMQFYDRLTQHVSHLMDFMSGTVAKMDSEMRGEDGGAGWSELRARLRRRLISDEQRQLLDVFIPADGNTALINARSLEAHADPGSIELF